MSEAISKALLDILTAAIIAGIAVGAAYLKRLVGTERLRQIGAQLELKKELAEAAVRFAQQAYKDLGGAAKYDAAARWLAAQAQAHGLQITDAEIKGLIEAALRELKDVWGETWDQAKCQSCLDDEAVTRQIGGTM
jgi:LL-H family phage holin